LFWQPDLSDGLRDASAGHRDGLAGILRRVVRNPVDVDCGPLQIAEDATATRRYPRVVNGIHIAARDGNGFLGSGYQLLARFALFHPM